MSARLVLLHKQSTSSRVRFLRLETGMLCFEPLPAGTLLLAEAPQQAQLDAAIAQAEPVRQDALQRLALKPGDIEIDPECCVWASCEDQLIPVLLGVFTTIDPPITQAEQLNARFIAMTEARALPAIEQLILRQIYEYVIG